MTPEQRIMKYVAKQDNGCWLWIGCVKSTRKPYGRLIIGSRSEGTRRSSVNIVCLRANDERWLISIGPRGGWKFLWSFGTGRF